MPDVRGRRMASFTEADGRPVSTATMKRLEDEGAAMGISKLMMMENAGSAVARTVIDCSGGKKRMRVLLIAGTGNNGGDVFAAARHLAYYHGMFSLDTIVLGSREDVRSPEAASNLKILEQIHSVRLNFIDSIENLSILQRKLSASNIVVVGIFGTGFHGEPRDLQKTAIEMVNRTVGPTKISVDLPSGMEADSGRSDYAVKSEITITMHRPKKGMIANTTAKSACGRLLVANIGLPL